MLIDLGWPGTFGTLLAELKRMDIPLEELRYGLVTHFHIDHAGLGQDLKDHGVPLLVLESQVEAIPLMKTWIKPQDNYNEINPYDNIQITFRESRKVLSRIGISGEIVPTPGHSPDSISVLLDNGIVFTGDLPPEMFTFIEDNPEVVSSWQLLRKLGATKVYPAHGPVRSLDGN